MNLVEYRKVHKSYGQRGSSKFMPKSGEYNHFSKYLNQPPWTETAPTPRKHHTTFGSLCKLTSLFSHSMTITWGIPDILVTSSTLNLWIQLQNILGMMNARGGVCIEHNLPNLHPVIERSLKVFITTQNKANIRWIVGNPYGGHWSSFGTPEASHTCLTILYRGLIWCSQEYHSDEAQMVVELQMMVDTVVDLSCNTLSGPLESANLLLLLPARTQHQSFVCNS
jgi:hypothetical protein